MSVSVMAQFVIGAQLDPTPSQLGEGRETGETVDENGGFRGSKYSFGEDSWSNVLCMVMFKVEAVVLSESGAIGCVCVVALGHHQVMHALEETIGSDQLSEHKGL